MSQIQRRHFLIATSLLLVAPFARAQERTVVRRIGYLAGAPPGPLRNIFRAGMRDLGWIEGKNLSIEYRGETPERVSSLAGELVALKPELIVAVLNLSAIPVKKLTASIPFVVLASHAPVEMGLVRSLSRPGSNRTGTVSMAADLDAKRIELLKAVVPKLASVGYLYTELEPAWRFHLKELEEAGQSVGVSVRAYDAQDLEAAFAAIASRRPHALLVQTDAVTFPRREQIVELSQRQRIPVMFEFRQFVEAGGLMSYGPDLASLIYRGAYYADKILRGVHPSDLPMEQPTKFELVLNLQTAKALGLTIPQSILLRADRVIE